MDSRSLAGFALPPRDEIEAAVRAAGDRLRNPNPQPGDDLRPSLTALSRMLLGPVADRLAGKQRLVVVADGALHYLPFAALTEPGGSSFLILRHEIVSLPSASVLPLLRSSRQSPARATAGIAILADPVFDVHDPRVARLAPPAGGQPEASRSAAGASVLSRLPSTRSEADAIAALGAPGQVVELLGFEASRANVLSGRLAPYRIVHFATHGLIDSRIPRLSGLVLSQVDAAGHPQDGFLGLGDVYNLRLGADLVVLSGCETALGREIRGEGLVGLTQGFLYAGASRLLASLWPVRDRATAELMTQFYRSTLHQGLPPAAASALRPARPPRRPPLAQPLLLGALRGDRRLAGLPDAVKFCADPAHLPMECKTTI